MKIKIYNKNPNFKTKAMKHQRWKTLLKLKLIKTKIYKENQNFKIEDIEHRLRKGLQIISKYHLERKKILFLGNFKNIQSEFKFVLQKMKHKFLLEAQWSAGMLTNCWKTSIKYKFDLIVILNKIQNNDLELEINKLNKPTITLNINLNNLNLEPNYKIPGNFLFEKKKARDSFFFNLVQVIIKKKRKKRKKNFYINSKKRQKNFYYKNKYKNFYK